MIREYIFYSGISYFLHNLVLSLCIGSLIAGVGFALYRLTSLLFQKRLVAKIEKKCLLFVLGLFVIPYQTFFFEVPTFLQLFGQYIEWTPEMYEKAIEEMQKNASWQYMSPDFNLPYFYEGMVLFSYIWLSIFAYRSVRMMKEYWCANQQLQTDSKEITASTSSDLYAELNNVSRLMKSEKVRLYANAYISTPMLIGFTKPRVILPESFLAEPIENITPILTHELMHYKQKDLWIKLVGQIVLNMHWFNPIVKKLLSILDFLSEIICDEAVVFGLSQGKKEVYAQSILNSMKQEKMMIGSVARFGDDRWECQSVKTRLELILSGNQKGNQLFSVVFLWCFVLLGLNLCFRFGTYAPRIDSFLPYVYTVYPDFHVYLPSWFSMM